MNIQPTDITHRMASVPMTDAPAAPARSAKTAGQAPVTVGQSAEPVGFEMGCVESVPDQALVRNDPLGNLFKAAFDFPAPPPPDFA